MGIIIPLAGDTIFENSDNQFVRRTGVTLDAHNVAHNDNWVYGIIAGLESGFIRNWSTIFQVIRTMGTNQSGEIVSYSEMAGLDSYSAVLAVKSSNKLKHNIYLKSSVNVAIKQYSDLSEARQLDLIPHMQLEFSKTIAVFVQLAYQYREASIRVYKHGIRVDMGLSYSMGTHW